jgi:hypothetical protein
MLRLMSQMTVALMLALGLAGCAHGHHHGHACAHEKGKCEHCDQGKKDGCKDGGCDVSDEKTSK